MITDHCTVFFSVYVPPIESTPPLTRGIGVYGLRVSRDYLGASNVGIRALLVRRPGKEGEGEHKDPGEDLTGVSVVHSLSEVVDQVLRSRSDTQNFQASA